MGRVSGGRCVVGNEEEELSWFLWLVCKSPYWTGVARMDTSDSAKYHAPFYCSTSILRPQVGAVRPVTRVRPSDLLAELVGFFLVQLGGLRVHC